MGTFVHVNYFFFILLAFFSLDLFLTIFERLIDKNPGACGIFCIPNKPLKHYYNDTSYAREVIQRL